VECQYECAAAAVVIIFIAIKLTPSPGLRNVFTDERAAHCSLRARNYTVPSLLWQFFPLRLRLRETSILNEEICKPHYQSGNAILPDKNKCIELLFTIYGFRRRCLVISQIYQLSAVSASMRIKRILL
jgi:hypothetical protein